METLHQQDLSSDFRPRSEVTEYFKQNINRPMIQLVNLDLNFAKIGTFMSLARILISPFMPTANAHGGDFLKTAWSFVDDMMLKIRQVCQYSIHARPTHLSRPPDDISSDSVHNFEAVALGRRVYNLNAFVAPWLAPLKMFFPHSDHSIVGIPSRMMHSLDQVIGKITNLFWNVRRVSKALVPYDGGVTTEALVEKQNAVRDLVSYVTNSLFIKPYKTISNLIRPDSNTAFDNQLEWRENFDKNKIKEIFLESISNWLGNVRTLFHKDYKSPHQSNKDVYKKVGSEEPENHPLYVRSKILSQVLGLPAGLIGGASNTISIGLNVVGNFFNNIPLLKASESLTNLANSLMAMVYFTGEVPANLNQYLKIKNKTGVGDNRHLLVAGIGALGMLNRIKHAPIIGSIMKNSGLNSLLLLDRFNNQFEKLFLGFFSANRWLLHDHERIQAQEVSSAEDLESFNKHNSLYKRLTLPLRVILGDEEVSYKADNQNFYRQLNPSTSPTM